MVSRLVSHKGLDLICEVLHDIMELPVQLVILGKGDQRYEEFFYWAAQQYSGRMAVRLDYNEALSMAIYAGADLFLMPSKSEPCGLSQMIAMRYGTVPIVREAGGLKDTVHAYEAWRDAGNGFSFANYASGDMLYVIREAVQLYKENPDAFDRLRKRAMAGDFSWARSAKEYLRIYAGITGQTWPVPAPAAEEPAVTAFAEEKPEAAAPEEIPAEKPKKKTVRKTAAKKAENPEKAEKKAEKPEKKTVKKAAPKRESAKKDTEKKETPKKETKKKGPAKSKKEDQAE